MSMAVVSGFIHGEKKEQAGTRIHTRPAESGLIFVPRSSKFVSYLVATIPRSVIGSSYRSHRLNIFSHRWGKILTKGAAVGDWANVDPPKNNAHDVRLSSGVHMLAS